MDEKELHKPSVKKHSPDIVKAYYVFLGLVESATPGNWLKPLFLMLVASTYALKDFPSLPKILAGFLIVGPMLWGGLYMLNGVTDIADDAQHPIKCLRPFPSGRVPLRIGAWVSSILIVLALILGTRMGALFELCLIIMCVKQLAYTMPWPRLKEVFLWDIVSGSLGNSTLRFAAGWLLFSNTFKFPLLILLFAESLQLAGFLVNRLFTNYSRQLETTLQYTNTTSRLSSINLKLLIVTCWIVGIISFVVLVLNGYWHILPPIFGSLPIQSLIVLALLLVALPFFGRALKKAEMFSNREYHLYYNLPLLYVFFLSIILSLVIKYY